MYPLHALVPIALGVHGLFLAAPAPESGRVACEFALADGTHSVAAARCPTLADWSTLARADAAELAALSAPAAPPKRGRPAHDPWAVVASAVEQARAAHPDGVIEEAWSLTLLERAPPGADAPGAAGGKPGKAGRAAPPLPAARRWALPGTRVPIPALPRLEDEALRPARESLDRATERLVTLRAKLQVDTAPGLVSAAGKAETERRLLLETWAAALEDALEKDPKFTKIGWLHLAAAYFELDGRQAPPARDARGLALLRRLREKAPNDSAASLAGLWLAGFALDAGDGGTAADLIEEGGILDPALAALYEAQLAFAAGDAPRARARVAFAVKHPDPLARAQAQALTALVGAAGDPVERAAAWEHCASALTEVGEPDAARRARLRAAVAWTAVAMADVAPTRIPPEQRPAVVRLLVQRGLFTRAVQVLAASLDAEPTHLAHALDGLALMESLARSGDDAGADALLADLARRFVGDGPFLRAHGKSAEGLSLRDGLRDRLLNRVLEPLAADRPLDDALRARLGPLVEARLTLFPPDAADLLPTARALAAAGFGDRAATLVRTLRDTDPDPARRLDAAATLVELSVVRGRLAGHAGAAVGPFLDGPPAKAPMPAEVRALLDAQTARLALLKPTPERDALFCDHAALRVAFGQGEELVDGLQDVIERRATDPLGLRAGLIFLQIGGAERRARDAVILVRKRVGPPTRETALRALAARAAELGQGALDVTSLNQRLFDRTAANWAAVAAAATAAEVRNAARFATGLAWALALRVPEASAALRAALADAPDHPLAAEARQALAELLRDAGDRPGAAQVFEEIAQRDAARAPDALAVLTDLYAQSPARLRPVLERLVREHPARLPDAAIRLARLSPPPVTPPAPGPAPMTGRFFPRGLR
jgi:tetratricopeptide (TPR) repeat protein